MIPVLIILGIILYGAFDVKFKQPIVENIARAIAFAEGFYKTGSLPQRANNPGNLKLGDVGYGEINDKTVFGSVEEGWAALYKQVRLMLTGESSFYKPSMTLLEVARIYTGGDNPQAWANNVGSVLGVNTDTTLTQLSARG